MAGDGLVANVYTVYAVKWPGTGAVTIGQLQDATFDENLVTAMLNAGGELDHSFIALYSARPVLRFNTTQLADALGLLGATFGRKITDTSDEVEIYFAKRAAGDHLAGASSHYKLTIQEGLLIWRSIRAPHQGDAVGEFEIYAVSTDGTTAPTAMVSNASLPSLDLVDELYTAGPVKIDSTWVEDVQNLSIDSGINVEEVSGSGSIYTTFTSIGVGRSPVIRADGFDYSALAALGADGGALPGTTIAWLRKKAADGAGNVSKASEVHISFTVPAGHYRYGNARGTVREHAGLTLQIDPRKTAGAAAMAIDTTAAIA
jgi:hypothetical protein